VNWKEFVTDYLTFSKKERLGTLVVLGIVLLIFFLPAFISSSSGNKPIQNDTSWVAAVKQLQTYQDSTQQLKYVGTDQASAYQYDRSASPNENHTPRELFYFDPNTLSATDWKRLGLRDKTINTIHNYISKGGKFKKPEDLKKIYGLFADEFNRIAPYIRIVAANPESGYSTVSNTNEVKYKPGNAGSLRIKDVDINSADTTAFIALPGIGSKLAARIINFRDKLGGFFSINQIGEIYALPDSTFQKIKLYLKVETNAIKKININTAGIEELKAHPYIKYNFANSIIAYRNQHGPFTAIQDLKKIMIITDDVYSKMAPYLTIQ